MFFFISKILDFLLNPITWIFALLLTAYFYKNLKIKKRIILISLILMYFFSNRFIFNEVATMWEVPAIPYEDLHVYKAGIVLGGGVSYDEKLERMQAHRSIDRVLQAAELYKKGYIRKILLTGGSGSLIYPEMKEAYYLRDYLLLTGIPAEDLIVEGESRNTYENALFTKKVLDEKGMNDEDFLLITSGFHMPRSLKVFRKAGIETTPYSTDRMGGERRFDPHFLLLPSSETLSNWEVLIREWVGITVYFFAGYL